MIDVVKFPDPPTESFYEKARRRALEISPDAIDVLGKIIRSPKASCEDRIEAARILLSIAMDG